MDADDETTAAMIDDEIYANGGGEDEKRNRPIISGEPLDVEAYASLYGGRTKISRLLFIAEQSRGCRNEAMELEALRMAYDEVKKGDNTQWFRDVAQKIDGRLGPEYQMDLAWCESVDRRAEQKREKLENELNAYRVCTTSKCELCFITIEFLGFSIMELLHVVVFLGFLALLL